MLVADGDRVSLCVSFRALAASICWPPPASDAWASACSALPVILPVRYAVIGETVVFRSGSRAPSSTAAMRRSVVAFEADR